MPVARSTPEHKRRVRTGCLTCRRRRRKCDERKPLCGSCEERNFACRYPALTFMASSNTTSLGTIQVSDGDREPYTAVRFIRDGLPDSPHPSPETAPQNVQKNDVQPQNSNAEAPVIQVPQNDVTQPEVALESEPPTRGQPQWQANWSGYFTTDKTAISNGETAILLHFQYHIIPWIEAGNPASTLGTELMRLADQDKHVRNAVIAASSIQLARVNPEKLNFMDSLCCQSFQLEAARTLMYKTTCEARIGQLLSGLGEILGVSPSKWGFGPMWLELRWAVELGFPGLKGSLEGPLEDLLCLHLRIVLAGSLLNRSSPTSELAYPFASQKLVPSQPSDSAAHFLNSSLVYLARCLCSTYGEPDSILASYGSDWLSIWTDCQQWYQNRSPELQPIVEIRSLEAGQIDTENDSSFPITIFTSCIALLCNVVYHITSRLLLSKKPRLLKPPPTQQRHIASKSWHAQQIVGNAMRNDFPEQWDPILITSLLSIGEDMTDPSQQDVLLECFRRITASTGIEMGEEIQTLRDLWRIYRTPDNSTN
ncbi:hypothetical protein PT974_06729 [Cladobotryum mycophilum]|uniref:Zn(2)-C6 fungal-type domain-containing protein n=1 Tax=Cladobotryum mycophilum TaxID=491253 RepID=A0ABR0SNF6_9HYPO